MFDDTFIDRGDGKDLLLQPWTEEELAKRAIAACSGYRVDLWEPGLVCKLYNQLEAVKRLAKAQYKDTVISFNCDQDALEFEHAFYACLAVGIDPKEL